ncbi:LysE family translocator [Natronospirillum operosum]|uniref:LysE family translocator n=1 Tax=Natronospirillum operosum TaxID=2759953 RepID=A0A4Z0WC52_9GAMM|nr:LysE family translocator [Natronospirillum operosum]TGG95752.1 LysE family translocator [Natronospirillum operosum]
MTLSQWLSLSLICFLGAATPGPSLIVIMRIALVAGRLQALLAAWSHAAAIGLYALLSLLFFTSAQALGGPWFWGVAIGGQCWLLYLGISMLRSALALTPQGTDEAEAGSAHWYQGLIIGLFNPKIWLFFTAVFSPFVSDMTVPWALALLPFVIDGLWYSLIAWGVTRGPIAAGLQRIRRYFEGLMAVLLIGLALFALQDSLPLFLDAL